MSIVPIIYIGLLVLITLGIIAGVVFLVGLPLYLIGKRFFPKRYSWGLTPIAPLFIGYHVYTAIYPTDEFYLGEFKEIAQVDNTNGLRVIYGSAGYPMVHGDYCSAALLQADELKFGQVLSAVRSNPNRQDTLLMGSKEFSNVLLKTGVKRDFLYRASGRNNSEYFFIGFLPEMKMLITYCDS
jgi:hypothetical protein